MGILGGSDIDRIKNEALVELNSAVTSVSSEVSSLGVGFDSSISNLNTSIPQSVYSDIQTTFFKKRQIYASNTVQQNIVSTEKYTGTSSPSASSVLGSFVFSEDMPTEIQLEYTLKTETTSSSYYAYIVVTPTYSSSTSYDNLLNGATTKLESYNTQSTTYDTRRVTVKPLKNIKYYIHLVNKYYGKKAYCNKFQLKYDYENTPITGVRSIQRGTFSVSPTSTNDKTEITISPVIPEKCVVLLDGLGATSSTYTNRVSGVIVASLTETKLTVQEVGDDASVSFSWQIIEYY